MALICAQLEQHGSVAVAHVSVEQLTHLDMQEVAVELMEKVRYAGTHHLVIDVTPVQFMASACLGVLVGLMQDIEPHKGRLALAGCTPNVAFLFKVTRLDQVIPLFDDVETAVAEFK